MQASYPVRSIHLAPSLVTSSSAWSQLEEAVLSSLCPPLTKAPIPCPAAVNEGARYPACSWPSASSVYPNGELGPVDCDPCRLPQLFRHGGRDGPRWPLLGNLGQASEWLQQGLWDSARHSLSPSSTVHYPARGPRAWRALWEGCNVAFTALC